MSTLTTLRLPIHEYDVSLMCLIIGPVVDVSGRLGLCFLFMCCFSGCVWSPIKLKTAF